MKINLRALATAVTLLTPCAALAEGEIAAPTPAPVEIAAPAIAAPPPEAPKAKAAEIKLSLLTFFGYTYVVAGEDKDGKGAQLKNKNGFNLDRAYINVEPKFDEHWSGRLTTDIQAPGATDKNYSLRVKFAYIDGQKLGDSTCGTRIGVLQTPFTDAPDKAFGFRVIAKPLLDQYKVQATADLGAQGSYGWNGGELRLFVLNGEGYERVETTQGKDFALQVNQKLADGLNLSLGGLYGTFLGGESGFWGTTAGTPQRFAHRMLGQLFLSYAGSSFRTGLEADFVNAKIEKAKDARSSLGVSLYGVVQIDEKNEIPIRVQRFDPDTGDKFSKKDEAMDVLVGYGYGFANGLRVVPNVQAQKVGDAKATITAGLNFEAKL